MGADARRWLLAGGLALCACAASPVARPPPPGPPPPAEALRRFLDAALAGDFAQAHGLLSARWRERLTPARLALDFAAEPLARRRLERAAAAGAPREVGGRAEVDLGQGRALVLVNEGGAWRVDRLE